MPNRLNDYNIKGIPERQHSDLIKFLKSQPEFQDIKFDISLKNGLEASITINTPTFYTFQYKDYLITVYALINQIYIACERISPKLLIDKYRELKTRITKLNSYLETLDTQMKINSYNERYSLYLRMDEQIKENKRQIKRELEELGIKVKPRSKLSQLLRLDYLPKE